MQIRKDNLYNFLEVLSEDDLLAIVYIVNLTSGNNYHLGQAPFIDRKLVLESLKSLEPLSVDGTYITTTDGFILKQSKAWLDAMLAKLDVEDWIDISTMGDSERKLLNNITGEVKGEPW